MNDGITISNKSAGNILSVEIDGDQIHTWTDYVLHIEKELSFPSTCVDSMDRYLDWMTDLSWLDQFDGFEIIIKHYSKFMRSEPKLKNEVINDFEEIILPFWEKEVQCVVVGGKPKSFNLGLID